MKTVAKIAFALIAAYLLAVGCSHSVRAQSQDRPTPTATPTSTATPALAPQRYLTLQEGNIAALGKGGSSVETHSVIKVLDGDSGTMWNTQHFPPQWLSIEFDEFYLVSRIELVISQHEAGPTTHEIWLRNDSYTTTFYKSLDNIQTEDGQTVEVFVNPPQRIDKVYVLTRQSQGWVAWYEVRVISAIELRNWQLEPVVSGLELPVFVTHAGDLSGRLFVSEHKGRIRIVKDGVIEDTPFLDISDRVTCCGEQGFYVIAFPPNYIDKQHFYVSYVDLNENLVISRFKTTSHPDIADPDSEEILLTVEQPSGVHNGGSMAFGPKDGYLYIGSGDGGRPRGQAERTKTGYPARQNPANRLWNPVASHTTFQPAIHSWRSRAIAMKSWALGIRNPWGFAFDSQTGDLFIPDAGQGRSEEVNFQRAESTGGENYGWAVWEGNLCYEFLGLLVISLT